MDRRTFLKLSLTLPAYGLLHHQLKRLAAAGQSSSPNILFLVFDTFSASHLSFHGYGRETTPNLARFAQRSLVYHAHYAAGNFTTPGTASLLTGVYPWRHRAFHINSTLADDFVDRNLFSALAGGAYERTAYTHNSLVTLLLDQLKDHLDNYVSARDLSIFDHLVSDRLFPGDYETAFLSEKLILPKDRRITSSSLFLSLFDQRRQQRRIEETRLAYAEQFPRGTPRADQHARYFILEDAMNWAQSAVSTPRSRPYLIYHHVYPPHGPYNTRHEFIDAFADDGWQIPAKPRHFFAEENEESLLRSRQQYDEFLLYTDAEFGRLIDFMDENGLLENTMVVVTSDHGQLFERGIHGHITPVLYEPVIRIPLLISRPGQQSREDIFTPTSSVDLLPTLLHWSGQAAPDWSEGQILPGFSEQPPLADRPIFAVEAKGNPKQAPLQKATVTMIKGSLKLIHYFGYKDYDDVYEMYDLANDPEELQNLYSPTDAAATALREELTAKVEEVNRPFEP